MAERKESSWLIVPIALILVLVLILLCGAGLMFGLALLHSIWFAVPALGYWESVAIVVCLWILKAIWRLL